MVILERHFSPRPSAGSHSHGINLQIIGLVIEFSPFSKQKRKHRQEFSCQPNIDS